MDSLLEECRRKFGPPPRNFSFWEWNGYLKAGKPIWCDTSDDLLQFFQGQRKLMEGGGVLWGHLIQANRLMFSPGMFSCPGEVVYCLDRGAPNVLPELSTVARDIGSLKGTRPSDPALNTIANYLTDERIRVFGLDVPEILSPDIRCAISTVFFTRKHLPDGVLRNPFFPIVVSPQRPRLAAVVPSRYWPQQLIGSWK